ncbi:hypothetical protein D9M72_452490 [compost metagenome]
MEPVQKGSHGVTADRFQRAEGLVVISRGDAGGRQPTDFAVIQRPGRNISKAGVSFSGHVQRRDPVGKARMHGIHCPAVRAKGDVTGAGKVGGQKPVRTDQGVGGQVYDADVPQVWHGDVNAVSRPAQGQGFANHGEA